MSCCSPLLLKASCVSVVLSSSSVLIFRPSLHRSSVSKTPIYFSFVVVLLLITLSACVCFGVCILTLLLVWALAQEHCCSCIIVVYPLSSLHIRAHYSCFSTSVLCNLSAPSVLLHSTLYEMPLSLYCHLPFVCVLNYHWFVFRHRFSDGRTPLQTDFSSEKTLALCVCVCDYNRLFSPHPHLSPC